MKKSRGIISLILVAAVMIFLGFTCIFGLNSWDMGAAKNINLGLDLEGGVSITYRAVGETPSQEDMDDTVYKLQRRVEEYSTEAQAYQQGDDRISIEIPGVQDANTILEELGQPGSLYFIRQNDSSGNPNYSINADGTAYELTKTIDELEADGSIVLTGNEVESASAGTYADQTTNATQYVVELKLNDEGTAAFADATQEAYAASESIAIYYDGELVSVPNVNNVIENGEAQITGRSVSEDSMWSWKRSVPRSSVRSSDRRRWTQAFWQEPSVWRSCASSCALYISFRDLQPALRCSFIQSLS